MADFGKINLATLRHKIVTFDKKGSKEKIECIVIPIKDNHLFKSEKGNVFADLVIFKMKEPQKDKDGATTQTHLIKQSLSKEVREKQTDTEKREQPIFGSLNMYDGDGTYVEREAKEDSSIGDTGKDEDLPY
jgi:hypothetical protein